MMSNNSAAAQRNVRLKLLARSLVDSNETSDQQAVDAWPDVKVRLALGDDVCRFLPPCIPPSSQRGQQHAQHDEV
jgi:hypothetical protein